MNTGDYKRLTPKELGRYMRYYRSKAGITAKGAAEVIGKTYQAIYRYESGATSLSPVDMFRLLAFYGVAEDDAFTEPWEMVDNPSRVKAAGSLRAQELMEVFASLGDQEQKVVMQVARLAKKSMGEDGSKPGCDELELAPGSRGRRGTTATPRFSAKMRRCENPQYSSFAYAQSLSRIAQKAEQPPSDLDGVFTYPVTMRCLRACEESLVRKRALAPRGDASHIVVPHARIICRQGLRP